MLDAAYAEYVTRNDYAAGIELAATCENVVMTRTFSKIYGLANLRHRLGLWAGACDRRAQSRSAAPFNVNGAAIAAGVAALADAAHIEKAVAHNARWLPWLRRADSGARASRSTPSVGNFLLLRFPRDRRAATARKADAFLSARGFILRAVGGYGLPDCLRLTVGDEEANRGVVAALAEFMRGDGGVDRLGPPLEEPMFERAGDYRRGADRLLDRARGAPRGGRAAAIVAGRPLDPAVLARVDGTRRSADEVDARPCRRRCGTRIWSIFCAPVGADEAIGRADRGRT